MKSNKFFFLIIMGLVILVVVSLVIVLRGSSTDYMDETKPEGVALNYLLAIQKEDYERAYGYLSPTLTGYPPTLSVFKADLGLDYGTWRTDRMKNMVFTIGSIENSGKFSTVIINYLVFSSNAPIFSDQWSDSFSIKLLDEDGVWKIVDINYFMFWQWNWNR